MAWEKNVISYLTLARCEINARSFLKFSENPTSFSAVTRPRLKFKLLIPNCTFILKYIIYKQFELITSQTEMSNFSDRSDLSVREMAGRKSILKSPDIFLRYSNKFRPLCDVLIIFRILFTRRKSKICVGIVNDFSCKYSLRNAV